MDDEEESVDGDLEQVIYVTYEDSGSAGDVATRTLTTAAAAADDQTTIDLTTKVRLQLT